MLIDAVRLDDPVAEGSNFTVITQDALTPRLCGQLFVSMKSVGFVPVKTIPDIPSEVVPGLDKVTFCGVLAVPAGCAPNVRLGAESVIAGVATVVPVNDTVCGLPLALSPRPSVAFFVPLVNGAKFIVKVQVPCGGMASPKKQALLPAGTIPKFPASLPVIEILAVSYTHLDVYKRQPDHALSDGPQSILPEELEQLIREVRQIADVLGRAIN